MSNFNPQDVKTLREMTGAGYMACKKALSDSNGDFSKATTLLREKGVAVAKKKSVRKTADGIIGSYIHSDGKIGVMVEINCETDFASNTKVFKDFVKDMAMHITALNPSYIKREDVPESVIDEEKEIYSKQLASEDKPEQVIQKIFVGKVEKFFKETCLLEQTYYKDSSYTVKDVLNNCIARIGENITIKRFVRYEMGE